MMDNKCNIIISAKNTDCIEPDVLDMFDLIIEIKLTNHAQMKEIYSKIFERDIPDHLLKKIPEYAFTQEYLMRHLVMYFNCKHKTTDDFIIEMLLKKINHFVPVKS